MKYVFGDIEPTIKLSILLSDDGQAELVGRRETGPSWLLATLTSDGKFQPNKEGCKQLGLTIDNAFNK